MYTGKLVFSQVMAHLLEARSLLHHGSRLSGLHSPVQHFTGMRFLRNQRQIQSQVPEGLLSADGQDHWRDLRSVDAAHRVLSSQRLPGQVAPGEVLRCQKRQDTGVLDQQLCPTCSGYLRTVSVPVAGGTVLPMDQTKPADQSFYGTSENGVKAQIWIAISVYVLVAIMKKRLKIEASLYTIPQVLSVTIFERMPLLQALTDLDYKNNQNNNCNQLFLFN